MARSFRPLHFWRRSGQRTFGGQRLRLRQQRPLPTPVTFVNLYPRSVVPRETVRTWSRTQAFPGCAITLPNVELARSAHLLVTKERTCPLQNPNIIIYLGYDKIVPHLRVYPHGLPPADYSPFPQTTSECPLRPKNWHSVPPPRWRHNIRPVRPVVPLETP